MFRKHRDRHNDLLRLVVKERDLCFYVQPRILDVIKLLADLPGQEVVFRHKVCRRIVDGHAPEDSLVAPAGRVHALCNVRRLLPDMRGNNKVLVADRVFRAPDILVTLGITDLGHRDLHKQSQLIVGEVCLRSDFTTQRYEVVLDLNFQRVPCQRIALQVPVQNKARNIVGHFVGMAQGNPFRRFTHLLLPPHSVQFQEFLPASRSLLHSGTPPSGDGSRRSISGPVP